MTGRFYFKKLAEYPHMGPYDVELWERFMAKYPTAYFSVDYDTKLGSGGLSPDQIAGNVYKENLADLSKYRIDVVGYNADNSLDCIEIRPRAGLSAFGSALGCAYFLREIFPGVKVNAMILTDVAQSDLRELCEANGVRLVELS